MGEPELRSTVGRATGALYESDAALHGRLIEQVFSSVPCLEFAPDPELWAELLVGLAIVRFSTDGDWQTPLTTALWLSPDIDRRVGRSHPIASFVPPARVTTQDEVPAGLRLYVDGEKVRHLPAPQGLHLYQVRDGDGWRNQLALDQGVPNAWLSAPATSSGTGHWLAVSVVTGIGGRDLETSTRVALAADPAQTSLSVGGQVSGWLGLTPAWQLSWDLTGAYAGGTLVAAGMVGTGLRVGSLGLSVGALLQDVPAADSSSITLLWLPMPALLVSWQPGPVDLALGGGTSLAAWGAWLRAGVTLPKTPLRVGLDGRVHGAHLEALDDASVQAEAVWWSGGISLGLTFGRRS